MRALKPFLVLGLLLCAGVALAQTTVTTNEPTTISVGTLAGEVIKWMFAVFGAVISYVVTRLVSKIADLVGVNLTDALKAQLQVQVVNGLNAAAARAETDLKGRMSVQVKSQIVAEAVDYAKEHGSEIIKKLGLDPDSGEVTRALQARVETAIVDPMTPTHPALDPPSAK